MIKHRIFTTFSLSLSTCVKICQHSHNISMCIFCLTFLHILFQMEIFFKTLTMIWNCTDDHTFQHDYPLNYCSLSRSDNMVNKLDFKNQSYELIFKQYYLEMSISLLNKSVQQIQCPDVTNVYRRKHFFFKLTTNNYEDINES